MKWPTRTRKLNVLIAITRPRDIPRFLECIDKIQGYDKLWLNYYPAYLAYKIIKHYFAQHNEYSHVAILPDDLIVSEAIVDELVSFAMHYDVITGVCNVDKTTFKDYLNVSNVLPHRNASIRHYGFIGKDDPITKGRDAVQVNFAGTGFMIVTRKAFKHLSFDNDAQWNGLVESQGCCQDVIMCNDLHDAKIPIMADFHANMEHLKEYEGLWWPLEIGKKEAYCKLERAIRRPV